MTSTNKDRDRIITDPDAKIQVVTHKDVDGVELVGRMSESLAVFTAFKEAARLAGNHIAGGNVRPERIDLIVDIANSVADTIGERLQEPGDATTKGLPLLNPVDCVMVNLLAIDEALEAAIHAISTTMPGMLPDATPATNSKPRRRTKL